MKTRLLPTLLIGLALCACAGLAWYVFEAKDRSLDALRQADTIRVGYAVEAPHAFLAPGGEVTGLSPELAKRIIAELGIRHVEWRLADFGALLTELAEGRVDVVAAGMFITPERAQRAAFSEPIFHARQGLLVASGNPLGLHSYEDAARHATARAAVLTGSVEEAALRQLGLAGERLPQVPDAQAGLAAVESGAADGLALSSATLAWMLKSTGRNAAELATPFTQPTTGRQERSGYGAFVFRKGDKALLKSWNAAQAKVMAGPDYARLMEQFGFQRDEFPGGMTTREVLKP